MESRQRKVSRAAICVTKGGSSQSKQNDRISDNVCCIAIFGDEQVSRFRSSQMRMPQNDANFGIGTLALARERLWEIPKLHSRGRKPDINWHDTRSKHRRSVMPGQPLLRKTHITSERPPFER